VPGVPGCYTANVRAREGGGTAGWQVLLPLAWLLLVGGVAPWVCAQEPSPGDPAAPLPAVEPASPPVRLDAIVTDAAGRRVLTLLAADFAVTVNGVPQPLSGLEVRTPPRPRVFALYLDEYHVSPGPASARVREAVSRFVETQLRSTDRVAVVKPLQPVSAIAFTTDRQALKAAVASFEGRQGELAPRSAFEEQFIGHAPAAVAAARAQIVTLALTELAVQLGELRADRAALVLVSEGFQPGAQGLSRRQGRLPDLQGVARAASRFHFAVYALSPEDLAGDTPGAATLGWLAGQTGGLSTTLAAELDPSLVQAAADMDAYYELHLPAPPTDGRFHRVEIATRRAGLRVRAGPGFWAPLSSEVRALLSGIPAPLAPPRALRRSPLIDAWVGLRPDADGRLALSLSWIPASPLPSPAAQLAVTARSEAGDILFEGRVAAVGQAHAAARFVVPPGRILFDMDVLGEDGRVLDTDIRDAHVPRFTSDVALALLPPEVLRARTLPEYRRIVQEEAAVPTPLRVFARSDRLVIRTPVWHVGAGDVRVRARVLNRRGHAMRDLDRLAAADGVASFDLPLSWLAPGEYYVEVAATDGDRVVGERIMIRVAG
jgi:VWFA-related protein